MKRNSLPFALRFLRLTRSRAGSPAGHPGWGALPLAVLTLLFAFCLLPSVSGQSASANLSGSVVDQNGAVVPGATVKVSNTATGLQRQVTTNDEGFFTVPLLPPTTYTVRVERQGFAPVEAIVVLNVGDQKALQIQLKAGDVNATVQVTTDAPLINESPAVGTVVDRRFVENMPLNGRSFQTLIALTPGVVLTASTFNEQGQFSVNGQRADANYVTVDGASANVGISTGFGLVQSAAGTLPGLSISGGTNSLVSVDAMQEFRIQTSTFAPEFGRTPGAQVSIVTRSGANQFHGLLFDYLRNDVLDANNWFNNTNGQAKPKDRQNDFGGTFSGPVLLPRFGEGGHQPGYNGRNRTFFFFSYEGLRLRQPLAATTSVPSVASRQTAQTNSPKMLAYLNAYPLPNGPTLANGLAQFASGYSNPTTLDAYSFRLDHAFNSKMTLFGRYNYSPSQTETRGPAVLSMIQPAQINTHTFTLGLTQNISHRVINEVRLNYSNVRGGTRFRLDSFGGAVPFSDSTVFPSGFSSIDSASGFNITGVGSVFIGKNVTNEQRQVNMVDNVSISAAAHQLKFGVDYRWLAPQSGPRVYSQGPTFSSVNSALTGVASSVAVQANQSAALLMQNLSFYGQDTWNVKSGLVVTYGVRWDINPPLKGKNSNNDPFTLDGLDNPTTMTLAPRGTPLYETTYANFAPRIGLSYQLRRTQRWETVLRGGFGLFYDIGSSGSLGSLSNAFPFTVNKQLVNVAFPLTPQQAAPPAFSLSPPIRQIQVADRNLKLPRTYQWNIAAEQSLGGKQTISLTYVGAAGRKLLRVDTLSVTNNPNFTGSGLVNITRNTATSDYHALQLQFQRRLSRGLQALASYTWSHSIDIASNDSGGLNTPSLVGSPVADRGNSDFDVRHSVTGAITYDVPSPGSAKIVRAIFSHWSLDNFMTARSALPITVTAALLTFTGSLYNARPNTIAGVPVYLFGPQYPGGKAINNTVPTAAQVAAAGCVALTATNAKGAFCTPATGAQGNLGRNVLRGFGVWQDDFALRRQFHFGERLGLQLRAEFFNIFNHPNFGAPTASLSSAFFGLSTQTLAASLGSGGLSGGFNPLYQVGGPRSIQLAARLSF